MAFGTVVDPDGCGTGAPGSFAIASYSGGALQVIAEEGESYRLELQRRIRELGLNDHVLFHPRFVELEELPGSAAAGGA